MPFLHVCLTFWEPRSTADQRENHTGPSLCLLPSSSPVWRSESFTWIRIGNPSTTNICNIQYMQATPYRLPNQAQRKETPVPSSHPHTTWTLSPTSVRSKANWERWMESFGTEITRAELSFPPPDFPSCGNSNLPTYRKGTDLTCQVCLGQWERRSPFRPKPFWTMWGIYTEPSTDTELRTGPISLWHTSLADNPVQQCSSTANRTFSESQSKFLVFTALSIWNMGSSKEFSLFTQIFTTTERNALWIH